MRKSKKLGFFAKAYNKIKPASQWVYDYPYGYIRLLVLAGAAGLWVYGFTKAHVTIGGVDAVAGVVAIIVVAHLLGGLKAIRR